VKFCQKREKEKHYEEDSMLVELDEFEWHLIIVNTSVAMLNCTFCQVKISCLVYPLP